MRRVPFAGAALLALGLAALAQAGRYEFGSLRLPGPGFLPVLASLVLIAAAAWLAARHALAPPADEGERPAPGGIARVLLGILAIAVYPLLLAPLGFLAASILLLLALFAVGAGRIGLRSVILAVTAGFACDLLFRVALEVQLPTGTLWGLVWKA